MCKSKSVRIFIPRVTRTSRVDLIRSMRQYVVDLDLGLAREHELDQLFAGALEHLDDPHTIVMPSVNFLVSGRKR